VVRSLLVEQYGEEVVEIVVGETSVIGNERNEF
jgi:hypothetical protein